MNSLKFKVSDFKVGDIVQPQLTQDNWWASRKFKVCKVEDKIVGVYHIEDSAQYVYKLSVGDLKYLQLKILNKAKKAYLPEWL